MIAIVKYQIADYAGEMQVAYEPGDPDEIIIARAKRIALIIAGGSFPSGYQRWKIVERNFIDCKHENN